MASGRAIDHVVIAGRDLDGLAARYEALGFTLTPRAYHEDRMGTSNRLAQFRGRNFIELLEVDRPDNGARSPRPGGFAFGAFLKRWIAAREGLAMIVFRTDDARADIARWRARGLDTYAPFDFQRQARLPDGSEATVGFSAWASATSRRRCRSWPSSSARTARRSTSGSRTTSATPTAPRRSSPSLLAAREPARARRLFLGELFGGAVRERGGRHLGRLRAAPDRRADARGGRGPAGTVTPATGAVGAGLAIRSAERAGTATPASEAGGVAIDWVN